MRRTSRAATALPPAPGQPRIPSGARQAARRSGRRARGGGASSSTAVRDQRYAQRGRGALRPGRAPAARRRAASDARRSSRGCGGEAPAGRWSRRSAARVQRRSGDTAGAAEAACGRRAQSFPHSRPLLYAHVEALQEPGRARRRLRPLADALRLIPRDARLHALQAQAYAALGKRLQQHQAQAEVYVAARQPAGAPSSSCSSRAAAGDGDFYQLSAVEARLKDLRAQHSAEGTREALTSPWAARSTPRTGGRRSFPLRRATRPRSRERRTAPCSRVCTPRASGTGVPRTSRKCTMLPILREGGVFRQVDAGQHLLVGHPGIAVDEMRAVEAESERVRRHRLSLVEPAQASPRGRRNAGSARRRRAGRPRVACASPRCGGAASPARRGRPARCPGKSSLRTSLFGARRAPGAPARAPRSGRNRARRWTRTRGAACAARARWRSGRHGRSRRSGSRSS